MSREDFYEKLAEIDADLTILNTLKINLETKITSLQSSRSALLNFCEHTNEVGESTVISIGLGKICTICGENIP